MGTVWLVLAMIAFAGDEPAPTRFEIVSPKPDGIIATGINTHGEVVGFEWVEDPRRPGVLDQKPFLARGKAITYLPLLSGYTATHPGAVSDGGLVVGYVSKEVPPGPFVPLTNQAFVWDAEAGVRGLGALEGDTASFASGVTRDGNCVAGYSVGRDRLRACVWERSGDNWKGSALPHRGNVGSNIVAISGDGRYVATVDDARPCLWSRPDRHGEWTREELGGPASLAPRSVNDNGTVVGVRFTIDGDSHAVVWTRADGPRVLAKPPGYTRSEAIAVNNAGLVVGLVDGPRGSAIGPDGFVFDGKTLRLLTEGGPAFTSATAINDRGQIAGVLEQPE